MLRRSILRCLRLPTLALLAAACLGACGDSSSEDNTPPPGFTVRTATPAVASTTPLAVRGEWLALLADEFTTGLDLNGDGGSLVDSVAWVVNATTGAETNVGVATRELAWLGPHLYLAVDESADSQDWGGTVGMDERVLLRWTPGQALPIFVDTLSQTSPRAMVVVGEQLLYASGNAPALALETSLRVIEQAQPDMPREVLSEDQDGPLSPLLLGEEAGVVLLALDETVEGRDLNGDTDSTDTAVLALLDGLGEILGIGYSADLRSTELALPSVTSPLRARPVEGGGRALGFLVSEAAQGRNLNAFDGTTLPGSWLPPQCSTDQDTDELDHILFYLFFDGWLANSSVTPVNTGISGADRIVMTAAAVGTISPEAMEGTCSLNGDGDQDDRVFRWIRFNQAPVTALALLLALDAGIDGPARGVAELSERFVIQVDEAADDRNHDGNAAVDRDLVGWIDPSAGSPAWTFNHSSTASASHATATWMAETPTRARLGVAFAESSNDVNINGDGDKLDAVATFAQFVPGGSGSRLAFPGVPRAVQKTNAGIDVINDWAFYRVSEQEDGRDWTGDNDANDMVVFATNIVTAQTLLLGPLNLFPRRAVESEPDGSGITAAFIVSEASAGDLNGNTNATDHLVRFFRF